MNAGELTSRVTIEQYAEAADGTGDPVKTWSVFAVVWAGIEALAGRELFAARQVLAEVTHRVRVRWLAGVSPKMRVKYAGRYFDVLSVVDSKHSRVELELLCVERVGGVSG